MKVLIDGDVVGYRCGFAAEKTRYDIWHAADVTVGEDDDGKTYSIPSHAVRVETFDNAKLCKAWLEVQGKEAAQHYIRVPRKEIDDVSHALHSVKVVMGNILGHFDDADFTVYFSCSTANNWRTTLYPEYKANRKDRKPFYYPDIREYMFANYPCEAGTVYEADDLISMAAWGDLGNSVIASIDKDFMQIPTTHYNWVKEELVTMTDAEAFKFLTVQRIMGDSVDNIKGCPGWGEAKAIAHLQNSTAPDVECAVMDAYLECFDTGPEAALHESINTAMVTLPQDMDHIQELMQEVESARERYKTVTQDSDGSADSSAAAANQ